MLKRLEKFLIAILGTAVAIFGIISMITNKFEPIADTNGPDDYSLAVITEEDIIKMEMGSTGGLTRETKKLFNNTVTFSAKDFSGVSEILFDNLVLDSDYVLSIRDYNIHGGNFSLVVVHEDEIVAVLEPGAAVDYVLENVNGRVSLRIAGESASFEFSMSEFDYELHGHY